MERRQLTVPLAWKIVLALLLVMAAHLLRKVLLWEFGFELSPYLTYIPAIILDTVVLDLWPGLAATALSGLLVYFKVMPETNPSGPKRPEDLIDLGISAAVCVTFCMMIARMRKNQRRLMELESEQALQEARTKLAVALDSSAEAIFICDTNDNLVDFNHAFATFHKLKDKSECMQKLSAYSDFLDAFLPNGSLAQAEQLAVPRALRGEHATGVEYRLQRRDTGESWMGSFNFAPIRDRDGEIVGCVVSALDITERKLAEEALRASESRYRAAFDTSPDVIVISRLSDGIYVDVNPAFSSVTGWKRSEVIGKSSKELDIWVDYGNRNSMMSILNAGQDFRHVEIQFRIKNGLVLWGLVYSTTIEVNGEPCMLIQVRDVTNEKKAEEEIRTLAFYDQVTGLANRRLLVEQFRKSIALSSRTHRKRALLFLDLDNFKSLNDTRGHHTGDLLLREVANRLSECVNASDTVSRLGGDEFVLILEELHGYAEIAATQAMDAAEKILHRVAQPYLINQVECRASCSIGITVFGEDQADFNHILQQADIAMYQAKAAGRNTMRFFAPGLQAAVTARATLEEELRRGLEEKQFALYFQPQFDRENLIGAEALLRWHHPRRGLLAPGDFIPLAEETRLILPLGAWVLENACLQIAEWTKRYPGFSLSVSVNVSALELRREDFVDSVLSAVKRTGANPRYLKLELTESVLVENAEDAIAKMTALQDHGIDFALDDFGTGYSSLTYLKRLPLSQLKIDRSFVRDILTDPSSGAITQTIIALSAALGLRVLSEGVEMKEQRVALEALGCYCHQGYLFGAPQSPENFELLLKKHSGDAALLPA